MRIELNNELKVIDYKGQKQTLDEFVERKTDKKTDWKTKVVTQTIFPISNNLDPEANYHNNYLEYLALCWWRHYGAVITPDIIWVTLLNELTTLVAENSEVYRELFSTSSDKTEIVVQTNDVTKLPLSQVMAALKKLVPNNFSEAFLPVFSTSTERSTLAKYASFADLVSPYYSYMTFCCGIPFVEREGTAEDWNLLAENWTIITGKLLELNEAHQKYFDRVKKILNQISLGEESFYKNMFYSKRCGSGSEEEVFGWFTELFRVQPKGVRKTCNFSTHVSKVEYTNLDTGREFILYSGLFYSNVQDNKLVPDFGHIILEKK